MNLDERMSVEKFRELQAAQGAGKRKRQPESYVVSAAVDLAAARGWKARKFRESPFGVKGCPDLLLTAPAGFHVWAEAKRPKTARNPGGRVRPAQREFLLEERAFGVPSCVFDEALDLEPVFAQSFDVGRARAASDVLLSRFVPEAGYLVPDSTLAGETPEPVGEKPKVVPPWR